MLVFCLLFLALFLNGCGFESGTEVEAAAPAQTAEISAPALYVRVQSISSAEQAMQLLREGNERFRKGTVLANDLSLSRRNDLAQNGQQPFAVIVSCSDSRVPPEEIFDQGLGDLFVVRVAGNVITPVELGSIEYAVEHLKIPLIVVLGHEQCGAVTAAVEGETHSGSIGAIVDNIKPAVIEAKRTVGDKEHLIEKAAELNVLNALAEIEQSPVIQHALNESLQLYGAKYDLHEGRIDWFDAQ
jgi:carbonic anhydrase